MRQELVEQTPAQTYAFEDIGPSTHQRHRVTPKVEENDLLGYRATLPDNYVYVSTGVIQHILYCLPRQSLELAALSPTPDLTTLHKNLVVIKMRRRPLIQVEYDVLHDIHTSTDPALDAVKTHFLSLLSVSSPATNESSLAYLVLPAVLPSITLSDWHTASAETEFPIPSIYHIFLSLTTALIFFHKRVRIEHGDLHEENVLFCFSSSSEFGLPELVLIDLEQKRQGDGDVSRDY